MSSWYVSNVPSTNYRLGHLETHTSSTDLLGDATLSLDFQEPDSDYDPDCELECDPDNKLSLSAPKFYFPSSHIREATLMEEATLTSFSTISSCFA
ncbi:hypothetical protein RDI58_029140 [Solanum bulbocastanum]|uniref:Uncharacterized protein n=1 Tax=Solanum bulbocastanum TaxID=147425 RepID=A0AAN8SXI1_SOLBU